MQRWMLSKFFRDDDDRLTPIAGAYGLGPFVPRNPASDDGWALVLMDCSPAQIEAAREDANIVVCPLTFDPAGAPAAVTDAYASLGVTAGMAMGAILARLAETEPLFGQT